MLNSKIKNRNSKMGLPKNLPIFGVYGFTIMEVMLVLVVVGIMVSGILPLYLSVVKSNKSAAYYSKAYRIADSQVETYRRTPFDNLAIGTTQTNLASLPNGKVAVTISNNIDGATQNDIKQIDLTVSWFYKKSGSAKISTYIIRNGVGR